MPPSVRWMAPSMIIRGRDTLVSVDVGRSGRPVTITGSSSLTVLTADRTEISGSPFAVTVNGKTFSAVVPAASTDGLEFSGAWMVMLEFEIAEEQVYTAYNAAALVRSGLNPPVAVSDLESRVAMVGRIQFNGQASLQGHIDLAWAELLSRLYADESPFWTVRSPSSFRPWVLTKSLELALRDPGSTLGQNNPYTREADRLAALLPLMYETMQLRLDDDQANTLSDRSSPVVDTRRR